MELITIHKVKKSEGCVSDGCFKIKILAILIEKYLVKGKLSYAKNRT